MKSASRSILLQYYRREKPSWDRHDIKSIQVMSGLLQEFSVDKNGRITIRGSVKALMDILNLRYLDVLALAFVVSKRVSASRDEFELLAWEFNIKNRNVKKTFNRLCILQFTTNIGLDLFKLSSVSKLLLKQHMPLLRKINLQRDELFQYKWSKNHIP